MKKIGLVGGTGPESTLMYYKILNTEIDRITGGAAMPDIAIESVNFTRAWQTIKFILHFAIRIISIQNYFTVLF